GEVQPHRPVQRKGLLVNPLAAANVDFAGKGLRKGERVGKICRHAHARLLERTIRRDYYGPAPVRSHARPRLVTNSAEHADFSGGFVVEKFHVLGNRPWQLSVAADHTVFGAGYDEIEQLGHGGNVLCWLAFRKFLSFLPPMT